MKDPAFLFYPNDYIGGTMGMTFEEKGAYMELLMMQFNRGHMTNHMVGQVVGQLWVNIQHKFKQDKDGLWYNERLEIEKNKRKAFADSRRNNLKGINQHTNKEGHKGGHMTNHMENRNENENEIINNDAKKIPKLEEFVKYALEQNMNVSEKAVELKYKAWRENSWRDGNDKPIKNWKTKLLNTLQYLSKNETSERSAKHKDVPSGTNYSAGWSE